MAQCDEAIKQDISINCDDPIMAGIEANGVIINRADIDIANSEFDETRKNVLKTLTLKAGKRGYKIYVPGTSPFNNTQTTLEVGTNRATFTHDVGFVILDNDPDVCENIIDALANGEFVVVYENKFKNMHKASTPGDSAFQVVGWYQGLKASTLENNKYSEDTEGGWNVVLQETKSPKSGLFLFNTDYDTTRTAFEKLTEDAA